jgi:GNAT superfamily N-acetyltransferase
VIVRRRTDEDVDRCLQLARIVHELDGYPPYLPTDLRGFIVSMDALAAWVADRDGDVIGHIALHRRTSDEVMGLASGMTGRPPEHLGVVARLLVSPEARREGIGRALLRTAEADAVDRGLCAVLDVATQFEAAHRLYEACGWSRVGAVTAHFEDGAAVDEFVYLAHPNRWPAPSTT